MLRACSEPKSGFAKQFPAPNDLSAIETMGAHVSASNTGTLNGWKDIAKFFGRGVRTVQRWERDLGLPVYRIRNSEQSPVFTFARELRLWLESRSADGKAGVQVPAHEREAAGQHNDRARTAATRSQELTLQLARRIVEQSRRTQALTENLKNLLAALPGRRNSRAVPEADETFIANA